MFAAEVAKNPIVEILIYLCIMYCYYDNECSRLLPLLFLSESAASPFRQICSINSFGAEPFLFCLIWALCPADENKIFQFQSSQSPLHLWFIHPLPCLFFPNARFFIFCVYLFIRSIFLFSSFFSSSSSSRSPSHCPSNSPLSSLYFLFLIFLISSLCSLHPSHTFPVHIIHHLFPLFFCSRSHSHSGSLPLCLCSCLCLSVCLCVSLVFSLSACLCFCLYIWLCLTCLPVCLSLCLLLCTLLFVCLRVYVPCNRHFCLCLRRSGTKWFQLPSASRTLDRRSINTDCFH